MNLEQKMTISAHFCEGQTDHTSEKPTSNLIIAIKKFLFCIYPKILSPFFKIFVEK